MAAKNRQTRYVKDHVTRYGRNLQKATEKKFSITNAQILRAAMGDEKELIAIADMGKLGERLQLTLPQIQAHLQNYIKGTTQYNQTLATIYKEGGNAASQIDKFSGDLSLADLKYLNQQEENELKLSVGFKAEETRFNDSIDMIQLEAWIASQMRQVDNQYKIESTVNKPAISQIQADADYENRKIQALLKDGSNADLSLLPKKQYISNSISVVWERVKEFFS